MIRLLVATLCCALVAPHQAARAGTYASLIPPVDAAVSVVFSEPPHRFAPGHRGIDYAVASGTRVRAAGAGMVIFAGSVGDVLAVTVAHDQAFESTYSSLSEIYVHEGDLVQQGTWIGASGSAHPGGDDGLHFGIKRGDVYADPALFLGGFDVSRAIHLAPLVWQPPAQMPAAFRDAFADAGTYRPLCRPTEALVEVPPAPNDNIAVAVAGISSSTRRRVNADMYEHGPEELGYPEARIYRFSYAGLRGPRLHRPYAPADTYGDIARAAARLQRLMSEIGRRHPGARVDLIAHSMGGLVARRYLTHAAKRGAGDLPRVEHLVTLATPHAGAAMALLPERLSEQTLSGGFLVEGAGRLSRSGAPWPDPTSTAVAQLAPGSELLGELDAESVLFGTRALALGIPNDLVVTADRASWPEARSAIVPPAGIQGHSSIVASDVAQGLAHSFLRDAPPPCRGAWDLWGPRVGSAVGLLESQAARGLAAVEAPVVGRVLRAGALGRRLAATQAGRLAGRLLGRLVHRAGVEIARPRT